MIITTTSSFQAVPVLSVFDVLCVISLPCRRVPNDLLHVKAASSNYLVIATALCHKLLLLWANILSVLDRFHCRPDLGKLWNNGGICCIWYRGCLLFFATNSLFQRTLIRHWHWLSVMWIRHIIMWSTNHFAVVMSFIQQALYSRAHSFLPSKIRILQTDLLPRSGATIIIWRLQLVSGSLLSCPSKHALGNSGCL